MNKTNFINKKLMFLILVFNYFIYYIIGHIFKTDILNAVTFRKNGASISFIGIFLLSITSLVVLGIIEFIVSRSERASLKNHN